MAEYIEREAAINAMCRLCSDTTRDKCSIADICNHVLRLEAVPAADVRPVIRGHIEEDENTYLYCSECNCNITLAAYETPNGNLILRPNFCPNCGAMMEES